MAEKIYCGNAKIVKTQFGEMTKLSLHKDDINKIVKFMKDGNLDWCNIVVKEKQNKVDGKPTHYLEIDDWKPTQEATQQQPTQQSQQAAQPEPDDLPF
jgi:hypothetical protein